MSILGIAFITLGLWLLLANLGVLDWASARYSWSVVLGDEPMGEVDTDTAAALLAFMRRINSERGVSFVIVTHDLDLAARTDRVIRLRDGHVISDERPLASAIAGSVTAAAWSAFCRVIRGASGTTVPC